jgi:hypothetical protein
VARAPVGGAPRDAGVARIDSQSARSATPVEIDATAGEFQFTTYARDNGDDEALPNGNVVDITFWLDLG